MVKERLLNTGLNKITSKWSAFVEQIDPFRTVPGSTAMHEAVHSVLAMLTGTWVKFTTIIPGPGYGGLTSLSEANAVAAVGPDELGHSGTGWDLLMAKLMGADRGSAGAVARSLAAKAHRLIYAVASTLQDKGTISGYEVKQTMVEAENPETRITYLGPQGERHEFIKKTREVNGYQIPLEIPDEIEVQRETEEIKKETEDSVYLDHPLGDKIRNIEQYRVVRALKPAA